MGSPLFSPKQREVWRHTINQRHRWNISYGATRSGKTYLDYYKIPCRVLGLPEDARIVLLGNTQATLERNVLEPMRGIWGPRLVGQIKNNNRLHLFGRTAYALGADKITQSSRIQGAGIDYCYGDEIATWAEPVFQMLKSRLDKPWSRLDGTCNPDRPQHWFKAFLDSDADIYQMRFTIDDNLFLDPKFVADLKREYAGTVYYDRFILGLWRAAEGVIYKTFADSPARYVIDDISRGDGGRPTNLAIATIGVDFGGNGSATAFSCTGITRGFREVITLDEYYHKGIVTPTDQEAAFIAFVRACLDHGYPVVEVYCDSAEQTLIQGFRRAAIAAGLPVSIRNARKGPINDRIRFYTRLMGADRYKVLRHCTHTIEALSTAVWSSKSPTKDVRLDDGSYNIDSLDALEYSTEPYMATIIKL